MPNALSNLISSKKSALTSLMDKWESRGVKNDVYESGDKIVLSKIIVPKESRNQGLGSQYMQELSDYADATGKRIELSPSSDFGGNKNQLKDFYSRFGFVENKGKNKDFTTMESMYRTPSEISNANNANILAGGTLGAVGLGAMMPTESQASVMDQPKENALKRMLLDYGGRVVDRVSHPLQTLATGLKDLTSGTPDEIAMNLVGAGTISKESQAMAKLIREAQAQIEAENAAKNALNTQPVTNRTRNALVGLGAGGAGLAGGYYGTDYLTK